MCELLGWKILGVKFSAVDSPLFRFSLAVCGKMATLMGYELTQLAKYATERYPVA
jgi:hypothetical protein